MNNWGLITQNQVPSVLVPHDHSDIVVLLRDCSARIDCVAAIFDFAEVASSYEHGLFNEYPFGNFGKLSYVLDLLRNTLILVSEWATLIKEVFHTLEQALH